MTVSEHANPDGTQPIVSVVMANFNGASYLAESIKSVGRQTLQNIELIVSDDGSTDPSIDVVSRLMASDPRIRLITSDRNGGPATARNRAIRLAKGQWIAVVDSDDLIHPARLATLLDAANQDKADVVADDLLIFDADRISPQTLLKGSLSRSPAWIDALTYIRMNHPYSRKPILGYLKPLIKSSLLTGMSGPYDETLRIAEDYDLMLRLLLSGAKFRLYPRLHYFYRKHATSISHRLNTNVIATMQASDLRLQQSVGNKNPALVRALEAKARSVNSALAYEYLVDALKTGAYLRALRTVLASPRAAYLLRFPIEARFYRAASRLKFASSPIDAHKRNVCIIAYQCIDGRTNHISSYLLRLSAALAAQHIEVHFLSPFLSAIEQRPILTLQTETSVFKTYRVRGAWHIGKWLICKNPWHLFRSCIATIKSILADRGLASQWAARQALSSIAQPLTREDQLFLAQYIPRTAGYLIADCSYLTDAFPYALRPNAHSAVLVHGLIWRNTSQFAGDAVSRIDDTELAKLAQADTIVAGEKELAANLRGRLPNHCVTAVPIIVNQVSAPQPGDSDLLLFVGSRTAANIDALQWFFDNCWPLIRRSRPLAQLWVAGTVSPAFVRPPEGVKVLGLVNDLPSLYRQAGVVVAPLRIGPESKTTLPDALAHGKAVVATSLSLRGLTELYADTVRIADEPSDFASAVVALLDNESLRVSFGVKGLGALFRGFSSTSEPLVSKIKSSKTPYIAASELDSGNNRITTSATPKGAVVPAATESILDTNPSTEIDSTVTVCICTFRRSSIVSTLYTVVSQILPPDISCRIIVVDNDFERTAEPLIANFRATTETAVEYVHAPGQNISIARNAGLDACKTRWLAFLDDDELASVNWLAQLMARRENVSAVFGPSEAVYTTACPNWVQAADLHSNRVIWRRGTIETGYTSNVLIDLNFVRQHQLRFNEELGRSGGEDTMFFAAMRRAGGRLAYVSDAIAYEHVPDARTTLSWVVKRRFRVGQVTSMMLQVYDPREYRSIPFIAPLKISCCVAAAVLLAPRPGHAMWWLMRSVFHYGILSYRLTGRVREEYSYSESEPRTD